MYTSKSLYEEARRFIPGGVNSPVRAFRGVGGTPVFFSRGEGAILTDVEGRQYIDYVGSWGPLILGHSHPDVIAAVTRALQDGMSFGAPTHLEVLLAEKVCAMMPSIEKIRMVNSGTEATMTAIRLARGVTGRNKILKFDGCYHGHSDSLLVKAGSGLLTLGIPSTPGVPVCVAEQTLTARFNHLDEVEVLFSHHGQDIAAIIVEPVAGNMGFVRPLPGFLEGLRKVSDAHGALLILDEVMTGFRVAPGGAQSLYGITPDITTLGKVIGGGMPVGAVGGKGSILSALAPDGPVYQAGTLSGNPLAMAAGLATLTAIEQDGFFENLTARTSDLAKGLREAAQSAGIPLCTDSLGGMFGFCFTDMPAVTELADVSASDDARFRMFWHGMLDNGVYFAPSRFEAGFVSGAHDAGMIAKTCEMAYQVMQKLSA